MTGLTGILACDPGWKGLAMTLFVPSLDYSSTRVFSLNTTENKAYKRPINTIPLLVNQIVTKYWNEEPRLRFVNKILIESQHKLNMQQLSWFIHAVLLSLLPNAKVEYISPLHCKRHFKIALRENHYQNKKAMLEYVTEHAADLVAGDTVTTHDSADSIIILNTFLKEKNRRLASSVFRDVAGHVFGCRVCGKPTAKISRVSTDPGTAETIAGNYFITCKHNCAFDWLEEGMTVVDAGVKGWHERPDLAVPKTKRASKQ